MILRCSGIFFFVGSHEVSKKLLTWLVHQHTAAFMKSGHLCKNVVHCLLVRLQHPRASWSFLIVSPNMQGCELVFTSVDRPNIYHEVKGRTDIKSDMEPFAFLPAIHIWLHVRLSVSAAFYDMVYIGPVY